MRKIAFLFTVLGLMAFNATAQGIAGDVNGSGTVDAVDVQIVINAALAGGDSPSADLDFSGAINAVDVQLVINAALGLTIDADGDGLSDAAEETLGTYPDESDTDQDGKPDGVEINDGTDPLAPEGVKGEIAVTPMGTTLEPGETVQLTAVSNFVTDGFIWASDNDSVAGVDETGLVTAGAVGEATITATGTVSEAAAGSFIVTVEAHTPENGAPDVVKVSALNDPNGSRGGVAELADGTTFPLDDPEFAQVVGERAPDLSTPAEKSLLQKARPSAKRISLGAWQTSIKNQQDRRTCVPHAVLAAIEARYKRDGFGDLDLSEQYIQHVAKTASLVDFTRDDDDDNADVQTVDGWENQLGIGGGGNIYGMLPFLVRYRVCTESLAPYQHSRNQAAHDDGDFERYNQDGDDPRINWRDRTGAVKQAEVNDLNMEHDTITIQIPGNKTFAPLPQEAVEGAVYGITGYTTVPGDRLRDPVWYEEQLAAQREIVIGLNFVFDRNDRDILEPRDLEEDEGGFWHAMLIVGYDRRDADNPYFLVKNSWGGSGFTKLSYDFLDGTKDGEITQAAYITGVRQPSTSTYRKDLYIGGWRLMHDGEPGLLDIHRKSGYYEASDLGGEDDYRLGAYFPEANTTLRVNGTLGSSGRSDMYIAIGAFSNLPYGNRAGYKFVGYLQPELPTVFAGTYLDDGGVERAFYAVKGDYLNNIVRFSPLERNSFLGDWAITSPWVTGNLEVRSVNTGDNTFDGRFVYENGNWVAMDGDAHPVTQRFNFNLPGFDFTGSFAGYIHRDSPGVISGVHTDGNEKAGLVLTRTGPATETVTIDAPTTGESFDEGASIALQATVRQDDIELTSPLVIWTVGQPYDPNDPNATLIIGQGASTATKRGAGEYDVYATYVGDEVIYDKVTIVVVSTEGPDVTIDSPNNGEYIQDLTSPPTVTVSASGSATDSQDGAITGGALSWYYRRSGTNDWIDTGDTGTSASFDLLDDQCGGTSYQIRLRAVDSDGNEGFAIIDVTVNSFFCR